MMELIELYRWTILSSLAAAPAIALIGAQLMARGWSTRALIVSQGSSTGVIVGLALMTYFSISPGMTTYISVLFSSVSVATLSGAILVFIDRRQARIARLADPALPALLLSLYAGLIATAALVASLDPHLESSMATAYVGDLSTASNLESRLSLAISLGLLAWMWLQWQRLTSDAFQETVLAKIANSSRLFGFAIVSMVAIAVSVQSMGLIFVLGNLFVPFTAIGKKNSTLTRFRIELAVTAILGTAFGFTISLTSQVLPTAPTILVCQLFVGLILRTLR